MDKIFDDLTAFEQEKERTIKSLTARLEACEKELATRKIDRKTIVDIHNVKRRMQEEIGKYLVRSPESDGVLIPQNFEDVKMKDVSTYVKSLFDRLHEAHHDLHAIINYVDDDSKRFAEEFNDLAIVLGISSAIDAILSNGGVVFGQMVTQVLLGERWMEIPIQCVDVAVLAKDFDTLESALVRLGYSRNRVGVRNARLSPLVINPMMGCACGGKDGCACWYEDHFVAGKNISFRVLSPIASKDSVSETLNFVEFDFLRNSYDGYAFHIADVKSLKLRTHWCNEASLTYHMSSPKSAGYLNEGFHFAPLSEKPEELECLRSWNISKYRPVASFRRSISLPDISQSPSSSSSSGEVETIGIAFKKRVEELGIDYAFVQSLFDVGDTHATGGVITQVLLKEQWDVDNFIFVCLANGGFPSESFGILPTCVKTYDSARREWSQFVYEKEGWSVPIQVLVPYRVSQTIHDATHILNLDFVKSFFDGKKVQIPNINSLIRKHHHVSDNDRGRYLVLIKKFTPLGFSFSEVIYKVSTAVYNADSPSDTIKKLQ